MNSYINLKALKGWCDSVILSAVKFMIDQLQCYAYAQLHMLTSIVGLHSGTTKQSLRTMVLHCFFDVIILHWTV